MLTTVLGLSTRGIGVGLVMFINALLVFFDVNAFGTVCSHLLNALLTLLSPSHPNVSVCTCFIKRLLF